MERLNNGLIYTNDNCIACNKCINQCSILGANVSIIKNGISHIKVDSRKCNDCGKCILLCSQNARLYRDDTDDFFSDLEAGKKMSVIIAPSFYLLYEDKAAQVIGYLKSKGIDKIYDAGFGAEISIWASVKYLKEVRNLPSRDRAFISNACPALVNVIEKYHPFLLKKLIPVHSPLMCTAIYAHKYLGDKNDFVFLGPCVSKKDEIQSESTNGNLKYNVTFNNFFKKISEVDISGFNGEYDLKASNLGRILPVSGRMADSIAQFFPKSEISNSLIVFSKDNINKLNMSLDSRFEDIQPLVTEVLACKDGCISGPGRGDVIDNNYIYTKISKLKKEIFRDGNEDPEKLWKKISDDFIDLIPSDFSRKYINRSKQPYHVPQSSYDEIFSDMLKDTPKKQNLNCGSCGYGSCKDMATAIACGYNKKENCIHYMNDLMLNRLMNDQDTGLMSRFAFLQTSEDLLLENNDKSYLFAVGDINKLSIINNLYSFAVGNNVLKFIGAILKQIVGDTGLVARLGGGIFAICLENTVENIQKLQQLKVFDCNSIGITFPVTMRFGIYMTEINDSATKAMDYATLCMNKKSSSIQNTYTVFTREFRDTLINEAEITSKMQSALENDEFKLYYQPQYSASTGEMIGAEVLCRWITSDGKMISPGVFIPISEKNGFIRNLDKQIWRKAFMKVREWLDNGITPVPVSLNISRISLQTDAFLYVIKRLKDEFKIPDNLIHFEITESAFINEEGTLSEKIQQIKELGYEIAMDDFGSGYSSLNILKNLDFDILKLDMGFVRGEQNVEKGSSIIHSVVHMAQNLKLRTVAEGVEMKEQADFLRQIGVNVIQGFLYARPMPEDEFLKLLKK